MNLLSFCGRLATFRSEISPFDQEPCHGHIQALLSFLLIHLRGAEGEDICDTSCSLEAAPIRWCRLGQRFCPKALASRYMLGRYAFSLPDRIARGELRPQRNPRGGIGGPYLVKLFHCYSNPLSDSVPCNGAQGRTGSRLLATLPTGNAQRAGVVGSGSARADRPQVSTPQG
jgi:hypothetical protein